MLDKDNLERFFETPGLMATHLAVYTLLFLRSRFLDSNHLRVADASSLAREKIVKLVGIKKRRFEYILADMVNGDVLCRLGRGIYVFNPYIIHEGPDIWTARSAWKRLKAKDNAPDPFSAGLDNGDDDEGEKANHEAIAAERG
jgi:hypothetical protein